MKCRVCHEREETHVVMRDKKIGPILANVWCCDECRPRVVAACEDSGETVRVFKIAPDPRPKLTLEQVRDAEIAQQRRRQQSLEQHLFAIDNEAA